MGAAAPRRPGAARTHPAPARLGPRTVARFLLEAKAVRERDIPATWNDELPVCQGALDAWVKRETGALHCLAPQFVLRRCWVRRAIRAARRAENRVQPNPDHVVPAGRRAVGDGGWAGTFGAAMPMLGVTALDLLDAQSRYIYPVFTPRMTQDVASMMYWYGEDDESFALDEACGTMRRRVPRCARKWSPKR